MNYSPTKKSYKDGFYMESHIYIGGPLEVKTLCKPQGIRENCLATLFLHVYSHAEYQ